jgi:hypothetical protein
MEPPSRGGVSRITPFALFALLSLCLPGVASAQWTSGGNVTHTTNNVAIGTMTPENSEAWAKVLDVYGNPHAKFSIRTPAIDSRVMAHGTGAWGAPGGMVIGTRTAHALSFGTSAASRVTITGDGNVGIGTTTPGRKLEVLVSDGAAARLYRTGNGIGWGVNMVFALNNSSNVRTDYASVHGLVGNPAAGVEDGILVFGTATSGTIAEKMRVDSAGNVGIGTTTPASKLHVAGDITVDGNINAKYQDVAEWVPTTQKLNAGTVVILDVERDNHVAASLTSYDTRVAGVISAQPGISLGEKGEGKVLVATTGRVKVRVDATQGAIKVGDLLVTSDRAGYAMKSEAVMVGKRPMHSPGTIIGKALESLAGGTGEILVLLGLQ